jgi:NADH-quinone oxidoreductase subunit J
MILFYVFAAVAVIASLLVIAQRNPIYSVLFLIASFGALSALYVLLEAPFVAMIQIIVYAGAIMVLFLFVVMLLNAPHEDTEEDLARGVRPSLSGGVKVFGVLLALTLAVEMLWALTVSRRSGDQFAGEAVSSVAAIGRTLFTDYAFQFEVTSVLILVALIGAVVLARRESGEGA